MKLSDAITVETMIHPNRTDFDGMTDAWRVLLFFRTPDGKIMPFGKGDTEYAVWIAKNYLDLSKYSSNAEGAEKFALDFIKQRYEDTTDEQGDRSLNAIFENSCVVVAEKPITLGTNLSIDGWLSNQG